MLVALVLSACQNKAKDVAVVAEPAASQLERQPPAPSAGGALVEIADGPAARRRLGYVNLPALAALTSASESRSIARRVLGRSAREVESRPAGAVKTVVRVGSATVLKGPGVTSGRVVLGGGPLARTLADPSPERSAILAESPSSVQSCLGDAATETLVGAGRLGAKSTIGVGLRGGQDPPAGLSLVICVSPRYRKQLYGSIREMHRRFGRPDPADERSPVIGEDEIGEQQIARGIIPVDRLSRRDVHAYLAGGERLLSLVPPPPR